MTQAADGRSDSPLQFGGATWAKEIAEGTGAHMAEYLGKSEQQKKRAYSPAVITQGGKTVWLAGQTATVDEQGNDISGNFEAQVKAIFSLLDKTLKQCGGSLANMVTMTVFILDPRHGDKFVEMRAGFFRAGIFRQAR